MTLHTLEPADGSRRSIRWQTIIAFLVAPLMLGGLLIWATWTPEERLDTVRAAVVNNDEPVTIQGTLTPLGRQLAAKLIADDSANYSWQLETADGARQGLQDGTYAAVVTIPEGFSAAATSYTGAADQAHQAEISVETSQRSAAVDAEISQALVAAGRDAFNNEVTTAYLENVYASFGTMREQLGTAADGASQLTSGLGQLTDGTGELSNGLGQIDAQMPASVSGAEQLADGTSQLSGGLSQLSTGANQVAGGAQQLASGLPQAADGSASLTDALGQLQSGAHQVADGNRQLATGAEQLDDNAKALAKGARELSDGLNGTEADPGLTPALKQLRAAIDAIKEQCGDSIPTSLEDVSEGCVNAVLDLVDLLSSANTGDIADLPSMISQLLDGLIQAGDGADTLADNLEKFQSEGTAANREGAAQVADGADALAGGLDQAQSGSQQLTSSLSDAAAGSSQVASGAEQVANGAEQSNDGASQLADATAGLPSQTRQLSDAIAQLSSGSLQLLDGVRQSATGSGELADGLTSAVDQLPDYTDEERTKLADAASAPLEDLNAQRAAAFGDTTIALFIALTLWLGSLLTFTVLNAVSSRTLGSTRSTLSLALRGISVGACVGAGQGLLLGAGVAFFLPSDRVAALIGFSMLVGVIASVVNQGLMGALGPFGRFLSLLFAVIGLAGGLISTAPSLVLGLDHILPVGVLAGVLQPIVQSGDVSLRAVVWALAWLLASFLLYFFAVAARRSVTIGRLRTRAVQS